VRPLLVHLGLAQQAPRVLVRVQLVLAMRRRR
jgi:hypothetical protein